MSKEDHKSFYIQFFTIRLVTTKVIHYVIRESEVNIVNHTTN